MADRHKYVSTRNYFVSVWTSSNSVCTLHATTCSLCVQAVCRRVTVGHPHLLYILLMITSLQCSYAIFWLRPRDSMATPRLRHGSDELLSSPFTIHHQYCDVVDRTATLLLQPTTTRCSFNLWDSTYIVDINDLHYNSENSLYLVR